MPSSYPDNIGEIVHLIAALRPKSVLDIGPGRGKYGFLIREYFSDNPDVEGHWSNVDKVDCVEVFEPYISDIHRHIYDEIFIGNILEMAIKPYDMYMIIDVLEHWKKEEAYAVLDKMVEHGRVLISTPTNIGEQGAVHGNEWECHISQWLKPDIMSRYKIIEDKSNHCSFIWVIEKK